MTKIFSLIANYLLATIISCFILGIGLSSHLEASLTTLCYLTAFCFIALVLCHAFHFKRPTLLALMAVFILFGLSFGTFSSRAPENPSHIYNLIQNKQEVVIVGTLAAMVNSDGTESSALIDLESLRFSDHSDLRSAIGLVAVRMKTPWPADILPGMKVAMRAVLQRPSGFNTPGSFDYPAHLARQDIWITGYIQTPAFLRRIDHSSTFLQKLLFFPELLRHHIAVNIDMTVNQPLQGIYRALLIGDQAKVDDRTRNAFRDSGCMHILSISGLHFAIIGTLLFFLLYWLLRRSEWLILHYDVKKLALFACLPPLCFYALLAGMNAPVLRSLIMSCIAILALCVDRRKSIPALLSFAALLILLENPQSLFNVSFQLSFAAIAAISAASPILSRFFTGSGNQTASIPLAYRLKKWLITALSVSLVATLGTAPLLLANFNQISLVGPLANLIVEPLICLWSLPLALLSCLAMPFSQDAAALLLRLGTPGLELSLTVMEFFNTLPFSSIWLATPHPLLITIYYLVFTSSLWSLYQRRRFSRQIFGICFPVLFLFVVTPAELTKYLRKDLTVTYLDVGQGSSTLLEYPGGYRVLTDGGGSFSSTRLVGESVIAPFLWQKGITSIDLIIITHPDADHYNGIPFITKHFSPTLLWTNTLQGNDRSYEDCIQVARQHGIKITLPSEGLVLPLQEGADLRCVANLKKDAGQGNNAEGRRSNDSGLLVQSRYKDFSVLFPGDISMTAEKSLIQKDVDVESTILLAAHHGSKTSNSSAFLAAARPHYLIVSAGRGRSNFFPYPGLAKQCGQHGIFMLTTADNGTIEVKTDGHRFSIVQYNRTGKGPLPSRFVAESVVENATVQSNQIADR